MGTCLSRLQLVEYDQNNHIGDWAWHDEPIDRSGSLFDHLSCPVRAKVEGYRSRDNFGCLFPECSATRISSSGTMGRYSRSAGGLVGGGFFSLLQRCSQRILQLQPIDWNGFGDDVVIFLGDNLSRRWAKRIKAFSSGKM